jgi:hypothetical protein
MSVGSIFLKRTRFALKAAAAHPAVARQTWTVAIGKASGLSNAKNCSESSFLHPTLIWCTSIRSTLELLMLVKNGGQIHRSGTI